MIRLTAGVCALLAVTACLPGKCSRDSQQKTKTGSAVTSPRTIASRQQELQAGKALFKEFCANCHPDGGNVSDPKRNLRGSTLRANHITTPGDIVRIMRNPLSRMLRFDEATISDEDAYKIAEYVFYAFR